MEKPDVQSSKPRRPSFTVILWRFFTGAHMDGKRRTDAGWFRFGREPRRHINWWNRKPRTHRALYRILPLVFIAGWVYSYIHFRFYCLAATIGLTPYTLEALWFTIKARWPQTVHTAHVRDMDISELSDMLIPVPDQLTSIESKRKNA